LKSASDSTLSLCLCAVKGTGVDISATGAAEEGNSTSIFSDGGEVMRARLLRKYQRSASTIMRPPNIPPTMAPTVADVWLARAPDPDTGLDVGVDAALDCDVEVGD